MENGYRHEVGGYAPETAVGTGAVEPLVDELEAAKAVPTVDENTLDEGRSNNQPHAGKTIQYSAEPVADDANDTDLSTGEDFETRNRDDETRAGAGVSDTDDAEVNQPAEDVRPEVPQETKAARKAKRTV